jgi:hypothetical protein
LQDIGDDKWFAAWGQESAVVGSHAVSGYVLLLKTAHGWKGPSVCKKSVQHKGIAMPKDGKPINISEGITIYTMKATPDFEVKINGKTSTVSYKSKRTIEEAWGVAVDKALAGKNLKKPKKK